MAYKEEGKRYHDMTYKTNFISPAASSAHKKKGAGIFFSFTTCINKLLCHLQEGGWRWLHLQLSSSCKEKRSYKHRTNTLTNVRLVLLAFQEIWCLYNGSAFILDVSHWMWGSRKCLTY